MAFREIEAIAEEIEEHTDTGLGQQRLETKQSLGKRACSILRTRHSTRSRLATVPN